MELGRILYYQLSKLRKNDDELREELNTFIERTTVLRECEYKYRFLDELLFHIIRNKNRVGAVQSSYAVKTKLLSLTSNEAGRIGRSLAMMLMTNTNSGEATNEYVFKYPALEELAAKYRWFKPMLVAIAEALMRGSRYVRVGAQEESEASEKKGLRSERTKRGERSGREKKVLLRLRRFAGLAQLARRRRCFTRRARKNDLVRYGR